MKFRDCYVCGTECETEERLSFDVRCEDCIREGENMEDESRVRYWNGTDRERELA